MPNQRTTQRRERAASRLILKRLAPTGTREDHQGAVDDEAARARIEAELENLAAKGVR